MSKHLIPGHTRSSIITITAVLAEITRNAACMPPSVSPRPSGLRWNSAGCKEWAAITFLATSVLLAVSGIAFFRDGASFWDYFFAHRPKVYELTCLFFGCAIAIDAVEISAASMGRRIWMKIRDHRKFSPCATGDTLPEIHSSLCGGFNPRIEDRSARFEELASIARHNCKPMVQPGCSLHDVDLTSALPVAAS